MSLLPASIQTPTLSPHPPPPGEGEAGEPDTPTLATRVAGGAARTAEQVKARAVAATGAVKKLLGGEGGDDDDGNGAPIPPPAIAGSGNRATGAGGVETTTLSPLEAEPEAGWPAGAVPEGLPPVLARL